MNAFNNPFGQDQASSINIDRFAEQMAQTLKKLNQNKDKISISQKIDISDNSLGSLPYHFRQIVQNDKEIESMKRQNPIKITAVAKKRIKTNSEYESNHNEDSQYIDSISNRKITEYFKQKKVNPETKPNTIMKNFSSNEEEQETQITNHPVIKSLRDKIQKKKKSIQQMLTVNARIKQRNEKNQQEMKMKKKCQKEILMNFMSQKYSQRIYKFGLKKIKMQQKDNIQGRRMLLEINQKIQSVKNQKNCKKNNKNKIQQTNNLLQIYGEQRQAYLTNWKKRLQNEKSALEKQLTKIPMWESINIVEQQYYPLSELFLDQNQQRKIIQDHYFPLYSRHIEQITSQIRVLNLQKIWYENLLILNYPKIMKKQRRMQLKSHIKNVQSKSLNLNQQFINSIFTNNTIFSQFQTLSQQSLVLGRSVWEQDLPNITLKIIIKRYEIIPQNIAKYIIRIILRAHERIRKQLNHESIILPDNIIFNERNDFKIDNWVVNQIYKFKEFSELLIKDSRYLYFPPEYKTNLYHEDHQYTGTNIWTVGVILYQMLFGKKPFDYSHHIVDYEQFYMMNDVEFPPKPQISQNCKQLIKQCLCKAQNRTTCQKALKYSFFQSKK